MNYKAGELLAAQIVEGVQGFGSGNVGRGSKWKLLNSGNSDFYAVLRRGQWAESFFTVSEKAQNFRTVIEVLQRVKDNLDDRYDELLEHADAVISCIDKYRRLGNTSADDVLRDANITGGDEVKEIWLDQGRTLAWIKVDIYLDWIGEKHVIFAE